MRGGGAFGHSRTNANIAASVRPAPISVAAAGLMRIVQRRGVVLSGAANMAEFMVASGVGLGGVGGRRFPIENVHRAGNPRRAAQFQQARVPACGK